MWNKVHAILAGNRQKWRLMGNIMVTYGLQVMWHIHRGPAALSQVAMEFLHQTSLSPYKPANAEEYFWIGQAWEELQEFVARCNCLPCSLVQTIMLEAKQRGMVGGKKLRHMHAMTLGTCFFFARLMDPFHNFQVLFSALHVCSSNGGACCALSGDAVLVERTGACILWVFISRELARHFSRHCISKLRLNRLFAVNH